MSLIVQLQALYTGLNPFCCLIWDLRLKTVWQGDRAFALSEHLTTCTPTLLSSSLFFIKSSSSSLCWVHCLLHSIIEKMRSTYCRIYVIGTGGRESKHQISGVQNLSLFWGWQYRKLSILYWYLSFHWVYNTKTELLNFIIFHFSSNPVSLLQCGISTDCIFNCSRRMPSTDISTRLFLSIHFCFHL